MKLDIQLLETGELVINGITHSVKAKEIYIEFELYGVFFSCLYKDDLLDEILSKFPYEIIKKTEYDVVYQLIQKIPLHLRITFLLSKVFPNDIWQVWMRENDFKISYKSRNFNINCSDETELCNFFELGDENILDAKNAITFEQLELIVRNLSYELFNK